jgi:hypothetical protein
MSHGEKDKLGDKLHDVEAARENEWARKRDEELLAKLRDKGTKSVACPECGTELAPEADSTLGGMACPERHGTWFTWDLMVNLMARLAHK